MTRLIRMRSFSRTILRQAVAPFITAVAMLASACGVDASLSEGPEGKDDVSSRSSPLLNTPADVMYVDTSIAPPSTYALSPCPTDRALVGGGFINTYATKLTASATYAEPSFPGKVYRWQVSPETSNFLTSEVLCLKHPSATKDTPHAIISFSSAIAAHSSGCAVARCPGTETMTGGGFANGSGNRMYSSYPQPGSGDQPYEWLACGQNDSDSSNYGIASYAICLPGVPVKMTRVSTAVYFPPGSSGTAIANCPSNAVVAANGFYINPIPKLWVTESDAYGPSTAPTSSHASASSQATGGFNCTVQAVAFCMSQ